MAISTPSWPSRPRHGHLVQRARPKAERVRRTDLHFQKKESKNFVAPKWPRICMQGPPIIPKILRAWGPPKWLKTGVLKQNQICIGSHHIYTRIPLHINSMIPSHKIRYFKDDAPTSPPRMALGCPRTAVGRPSVGPHHHHHHHHQNLILL